MAAYLYETNGDNDTSTVYAGSSGIRGGGENPMQQPMHLPMSKNLKYQ